MRRSARSLARRCALETRGLPRSARRRRRRRRWRRRRRDGGSGRGRLGRRRGRRRRRRKGAGEESAGDEQEGQEGCKGDETSDQASVVHRCASLIAVTGSSGSPSGRLGGRLDDAAAAGRPCPPIGGEVARVGTAPKQGQPDEGSVTGVVRSPSVGPAEGFRGVAAAGPCPDPAGRESDQPRVGPASGRSPVACRPGDSTRLGRRARTTPLATALSPGRRRRPSAGACRRRRSSSHS